MAKASPARRQNRLIGLVAILLLLLGGAAVAFPLSDTGTSSSYTTVPENDGLTPGSTHLKRPADVSLTWFYHSLSVEQFDYKMDALSCAVIGKYITTDLCAVVKSDNGDFMVVGTEGYWDPQDTNSAGLLKIPMDLTVYVMTAENGPKRAISVLDGTLSVDYDGEVIQLVAAVVKTSHGQVLALHKKPKSQTAASYAAWDELQVLAASPTGAPTVVGAYEGSNIHVAGDGPGVMFSSDRYGSPSGSSSEATWSTFTYLSPGAGESYGWTETMRSGSGRLNMGKLTAPVVADTYTFPNSGVSKGADA